MEKDKVYKFPAQLNSKKTKVNLNLKKRAKFIFIRQYMIEYFK